MADFGITIFTIPLPHLTIVTKKAKTPIYPVGILCPDSVSYYAPGNGDMFKQRKLRRAIKAIRIFNYDGNW